MSRFKFRLAPLLRLREMTRDERRAALADAYRVDDVLRQRISGLEANIDQMRELCRQASRPGQIEIDRIVETQRYDMALKIQRLQLLDQRKTVAEEIERRQQALLEADREVRTLEKLREKQAEHYTHEELRQEQLRLDEAAQQLAMREMAL